MLAAGIPAGPIYDYAQALDNDHAHHRGVVMEIDHPVEGKVRSIGFPVKLSGTPEDVSALYRPVPADGMAVAPIA